MMKKILYVLAGLLLAIGIYQAEPRMVLQKAETICLECIGIG